jgi:hypothetical protein
MGKAIVCVFKGRYAILIERGSVLTYDLQLALGVHTANTSTTVDILYYDIVSYTKNSKGCEKRPYITINNGQTHMPIEIGDDVSKHIGVST